MKGGLLKNLVIVGPPRCGKSTLVQMIASKYNCEIIHADPLLSTLQKALLEERIDESGKDPCGSFVYPALDEDAQVSLLRTTYCGTKTDLRGRKKLIIIDCHVLNFKKLIEEFDEEVEIYCLGVPELDAEDLFKNIRLNDTHYDWTYFVGKFTLMHLCENIVAMSKAVRDELKNYPNIKFVDTSINRREILEKTFKEIEENIIKV